MHVRPPVPAAVTALVAAIILSCGTAFAAASVPGSFAGLVKEVTPSVVNISTTQMVKQQEPDPLTEELYRRFFGGVPPRETERRSLGSGFVLSPDGYILTNNHVVANAKDIKVKLADGSVHDAKLIGADEKTDVALIKIDADNLPAARLGDSDKTQVGDWVIAVGNPFGLSRTVTAGIVSAKGREIGAGPYDDFIQTDASINPGNSGGPLFDTEGQVVGINTAINAAAQGIGFAIPINIVKIVVRDLKEYGKVMRGWLGASAQVVTPELATAFHMKEAKGLAVTGVDKDSPAEKAGLKTGDVIMEFGGKAISHGSELPWLVASSKIGATVPLKVLRDGHEMVLNVTIAPMPEGISHGGPAKLETVLGFAVSDLTPDIAKQLGLEGKSGVVVSAVARESQAAENGIRPGDLIVEVNGKPVVSKDEFYQTLKGVKSGDTIALYVQKQTGGLFIPLKIK